ncbi:DMT family transporter [Gulosibacter bifidus]|uniref:DMT family transporter n=1 Tax=Gulosibacter bifidus TaxID=272239 RepID=A0ABW5RLD7_9MICO|nr:SMR family transporter [Gulosibacter bifidus]
MSATSLAWIALVVSGGLECVWAVALSKSRGFSRKAPTITFVIAVLASTVLLAFAMNIIPTGTAYAFWVGIGAALTVIWAMVSGEERASILRVALIVVLVGSAIGLKVVA